jgi:hypothetical protein
LGHRVQANEVAILGIDPEGHFHLVFISYSDDAQAGNGADIGVKHFNCGTLLEGLCRELPAADPQALARQLQLLMEGVLVMAFLRRNPQAARDARQAATKLLADEKPVAAEAR